MLAVSGFHVATWLIDGANDQGGQTSLNLILHSLRWLQSLRHQIQENLWISSIGNVCCAIR
jgi:hypothetical protein